MKYAVPSELVTERVDHIHYQLDELAQLVERPDGVKPKLAYDMLDINGELLSYTHWELTNWRSLILPSLCEMLMGKAGLAKQAAWDGQTARWSHERVVTDCVQDGMRLGLSLFTDSVYFRAYLRGKSVAQCSLCDNKRLGQLHLNDGTKHWVCEGCAKIDRVGRVLARTVHVDYLVQKWNLIPQHHSMLMAQHDQISREAEAERCARHGQRRIAPVGETDEQLRARAACMCMTRTTERMTTAVAEKLAESLGHQLPTGITVRRDPSLQIYPGYDLARGISCCKTHAAGFRCGCAEPARLDHPKQDPYAEHRHEQDDALDRLRMDAHDNTLFPGVERTAQHRLILGRLREAKFHNDAKPIRTATPEQRKRFDPRPGVDDVGGFSGASWDE